MAVIVMGHYVTLEPLIAHVHRLAFPDVPWDRPSRQLLKHLGYLLEASLLLDVMEASFPLDDDEDPVDDRAFFHLPYEDDETLELVESVSVDIHQHVERMFPGHDLLTITPIDARGNTVLILTPSPL